MEEGPRSLSRSHSLHPLCVVRTRPSRQPNIGVDVSKNEGRKRNVEKSQTRMSQGHSLGRGTCTLPSPPLSFVPPSITLNKRTLQAIPRP